MFLQRSAVTLNVRKTQTEKEVSNRSNSEKFNSFQFWRDPLPSIDTDLLDLLVRSDEPAHRLHFGFGLVSRDVHAVWDWTVSAPSGSN